MALGMACGILALVWTAGCVCSSILNPRPPGAGPGSDGGAGEDTGPGSDGSPGDAGTGDCPVPCSSGETCVDGECRCRAGSLMCGDVCVDVSTDEGHCGGCRRYCPGECLGGACDCGDFVLCPDRFGLAEICTDTARDPTNCGACGIVCRDQQYCREGLCVCRPSLELCGTVCVDTQTNPEHCGACNELCSDPRRCDDGECTDTCDPGDDACDRSDDGDVDYCTDLDSDVLHCGPFPEACKTMGGAIWPPCEETQVCVEAECADWTLGLGCAACPCDACTETGALCCPYPGDAELIVCVDASSCPL